MISRISLPPRVQRVLVGIAATLICAAGVYLFGRRVNGVYPVSEWLVWSLAPVVAYALLFNLACVAFGSFLLRLLLRDRPLPALERLLQSMMLGLTAFVLALYVLGFCHVLKPALAIALPLGFLGAGFSEGRALWRELLAWRNELAPPSAVERVLGTLAVMAGGAALLLLYLEALDVSAFNFDAVWYHYPIAQDYARTGRIVPFPGENHRAFPHLTSMVHTWALLVPALREQAQHWMLSLHLEFAIVVWRLVGAATLARWLLGGRDVRGLWAGFFLFPSLFVYDQNIGGSADHFLGFFAVPVVLAAVRALERFDVRWCVLLGAAVGGHVLVKYQGVYVFAAAAVAVAVRIVFLLARYWLRARRASLGADDVPWRGLLRGFGALTLVFTLVTLPHFGKNAVFYGNPLYPLAQSIFKSSYPKKQPGFYVEAPSKAVFSPKEQGIGRQLWAFGKIFTYSFETANRNLTERRPYMGALFSLLLPCALLVPGRRRFAPVLGLVTVAFMVWANSAPNDRYLLSFYDLCIGSALALMVEVWRLGVAARIGLVPLVLLQVIWGGDAALFYGKKQLSAALSLIAEGYEGKHEGRLSSRGAQAQVTRATPKDAVILARNYKGLLGLDRTVLSDIRAAQDYISYSNLKDTREFYDLVKSRGVTHLLLPEGQRKPERWNNTVLFSDLFRQAGRPKRFSRLQLAALPSTPPPHSAPYLVVVAGIRGVPDGVWAVEQLDFDPRDAARFSPRPRPRHRLSQVDEVIDDIQAAIIGGDKTKALGPELLSELERVESWDRESLYLRRRAR